MGVTFTEGCLVHLSRSNPLTVVSNHSRRRGERGRRGVHPGGDLHVDNVPRRDTVSERHTGGRGRAHRLLPRAGDARLGNTKHEDKSAHGLNRSPPDLFWHLCPLFTWSTLFPVSNGAQLQTAHVFFNTKFSGRQHVQRQVFRPGLRLRRDAVHPVRHDGLLLHLLRPRWPGGFGQPVLFLLVS